MVLPQLRLECHKIVDELHSRLTGDEMQSFKAECPKRNELLFVVPKIEDYYAPLFEVDNPLKENITLFQECGPYSEFRQPSSHS